MDTRAMTEYEKEGPSQVSGVRCQVSGAGEGS